MMGPNSVVAVLAGTLLGLGLITMIFEGAVLLGIVAMLGGVGLFAVLWASATRIAHLESELDKARQQTKEKE